MTLEFFRVSTHVFCVRIMSKYETELSKSENAQGAQNADIVRECHPSRNAAF